MRNLILFFRSVWIFSSSSIMLLLFILFCSKSKPTAPESPPIISVPSSLDFGNIFVGNSGDQTLRISNTGDEVLQVVGISSTDAQFIVVSGGTSFDVARGKNYDITVRFTPASIGNHNGILHISNNSSINPKDVNLSGIGSVVPQPVVGVQTMLDFGDVSIHSFNEKVLQINNSGNATLHITGISSTNPEFILLTGEMNFDVEAGGNIIITVRFAPTAPGEKIGILNLPNNSSLPNVEVRLRGSGTALIDIDGNMYGIVKIGNQWWTTENLIVTHYRNGDVIPNIMDDLSWINLASGAYCDYENNSDSASTYGHLYNWHAVNDIRNIAPAGWRVPTDDDWKNLEIYLGMSQNEADDEDWRGTDEGGKLKEAGTTHWFDPNEGATNTSDFTALPGGYRHWEAGVFYSQKESAYFWSSSESSPNNAWRRRLGYDRSSISRGPGSKENGGSVRLIKGEGHTIPISELNLSTYNLNLSSGINSNSSFNISSNIDWLVSDDVDWLDITSSSGSNNGTITVIANSENISTNSRSAIVTVTGGGITRTVIVTQSGASIETGTMTDQDGNVYQTVKIGNQWWMAENLKVTHYRNGDPLPNVTNNTEWSQLSTGALCSFNNNEGNVSIYGRLYNFYAVIDSRNIAPTGWHVPTDEEWKTLEKYLGMSQSEADDTNWRGTTEGGKLKEAGTTHWLSPNTGATNEYSFTALPGGYRSSSNLNESFESMGRSAYFWCAGKSSDIIGWYRYLNYDGSYIYRDSMGRRYGISVRLLKD